jgi:microcystin-dependent protein
MSEPYLGQIEAFPYNFVPRNWLPCQGQLLPLTRYQALFALLGTTYGGNGVNTFALPDLRGRLAMGQGNGANLTPRALGQHLGEETHTIVADETPTHTHSLNTAPNAPTSDNTNMPSPTVVLGSATAMIGATPAPLTPFAPASGSQTASLDRTALSMTNGGHPHTNLMPFLTLEFCIAVSGIFPSRT